MRTYFIILILSFFSTSNFAQNYPKNIKPRKYNFSESSALALAKEMCSCIFISEQSESYCRKVTKESRMIAKYKINLKDMSVSSKGFGYKAVARFNSEKPHLGCKLTTAKDYNRLQREWHDIADYDYWKEYREERRKRQRKK